jgi:hypothetical protein
MNTITGRRLAGIGVALLALAGCGTPNAIGTSPTAQLLPASTTVRACTARQLAIAFLGALPGMGNDFGTIAIWDKSGQSCWLTGPIRIARLNRAGHQVTNALSYRVAGDTTLTAHGTRPDRMGHVKRLATGTYVYMPNANPRAIGWNVTKDHGLTTCRGRLEVPSGLVINVGPSLDSRTNGLTAHARRSGPAGRGRPAA